MTFRTASKAQQMKRWAVAALVALVAYICLSRLLFGSFGWDVLSPRQHRILQPIVALFFLFAWETRRGEKKGGRKGQDDTQQKVSPLPRPAMADPQDCRSSVPVLRQPVRNPAVWTSEPAAVSRSVSVSVAPGADTEMSGKDLFEQARSLPHQPIPDFEGDWDYLNLLGLSAAKGYPHALAKLGEYAMRRCAWVEAYYWMWQARLNGLQNLSAVMREIRRCWAMDDFPIQSSNVNSLFSERCGSIGRALLAIDSGHDASAARAFLRTEAPEFLDRSSVT